VPVAEGLFRVGDDDQAHLVGGRCGTCDRPHFPRGVVCPWCSSGEVSEVALSSEGTLWGWTGVNASPPGYSGETPFGFGVVELPEGIRVVTRLSEADPSRLAFGQRMCMEIVPLVDDDEGHTTMTWAFVPTPGAG
jgi:uncharacterized OB-fold protein